MRGWQMGEIIGSRRRLRQPMVWTGEEQEGASWEEALGRTGEALRRLREDDPASIGIVLGDGLSNEEAFAARRLADLIGTPNVASLGVELDAAAIHGLEHVLGGPYRAPAPEELDGADLFLCVSSNLQHINPRAAGAMARRLQGGARMVLIDEVDQGLGVWAAHYARHRPGARAHALRQLAAALSSGEVPAGPLHADDVQKAVDEIESSRRLAVVLSAEAVTTTDEGEALGRLVQALRAEMRWVGVHMLPSGANTFGALD
ncbi:MAG: molybdopterin-dependent oxidoreductase, partial [Armatimonadota bacterium]